MSSTNDTTPSVAPVPVATQTNKEKNKERMDKLREAKERKKAAGNGGVAGQPVAEPKAKKAPREPKEKTVRACRCGCGNQTGGYFYPGHDARFKGWLLKIERAKMEVKDLPESVQKEYTWIKKGAGMIPTTDYKGNPHKGYDADETPE